MNYIDQNPNIELEINTLSNTGITLPAKVNPLTTPANSINYVRLLFDFGLVYAAFLLSYYLRFNQFNYDNSMAGPETLGPYLGLDLVYSGITVLMLGISRKFLLLNRNAFVKEILLAAAVVMTGIVFITLMQFFAQAPLFFSRLFFIFLAPVTWLLLAGEIVVVTVFKDRARANLVQYAVKRSIDIIASAALLLALSILLIIIALAVKLDSKGPVIFRQTRVGKNGKHFTFLKFRSMHTDADQRLAQLMQFNETDGATFKMKNDPRVTRVGRILRRTSLDELPQLLNILSGQMSLVGPRPGLPREVKNYQEWQHRRLSVTPGLTGLWQVSGRSSVSFETMTKLDIYYVEHWSLWLDIKILVKTVKAVISGHGAY